MISLEPPRGVPQGAAAWTALGLSRGGLQRFVRSACGLVGLRGEVDVLLAGDTTLRRLNRQFRGKDKATDVLSFPAVEELAATHVGDLAVSLDTAARQAGEHGHTLAAEVRVLLLHGLLHLAGMDHEQDDGEMRTREAELRRRLRLPEGLIGRTEGVPEARNSGAPGSASSTRKGEARASAKRGSVKRAATTRASTQGAPAKRTAVKP